MKVVLLFHCESSHACQSLALLVESNTNKYKLFQDYHWLFFHPTTILSNKGRHFVCLLLHYIPFQIQIRTADQPLTNRWPTADQLVFFILPWVNFVFPWVKFVVPRLFCFAVTVVGHRTYGLPTWSTSVVAFRIFPILSANNNNTNKNN